ncbi:MAG: LLM class flavin-dependent oxidoreductase [SAR324 cluster bacterium]|nr:LLM class flavin-dependent oxidoreductase [SAR324 cluster bacterium]MCZ6557379.1 LLM class flavin-dependent oxidoreductase [SAR324 cluster bacterium]MCZ6629446.1 LLM class flavin-dependent oxidoreductase [SAR324 cluster bacterium]MCZ6647587.1 LLM class flavin-dependent oxidoreductase [SAR324 cluster bacterium]MCZ6728505.1 LLM class flavin-dependent oxidoreductase [SAR324 cluster bacterium]
MDFGAHLPLISFQGERRSLDDLIRYTQTASSLGYTYLCANDHLASALPWLDGPTALAAVIAHSGDMRLATTICLPVVRGPAPAAKLLAAIDLLSGGRLVVGAGPGSRATDHNLVGLDYKERWQRLEESIHALRAYFGAGDFEGKFYSTLGQRFEPRPAQEPAPPIWLGIWGAKGGLRRTASLADGWLASGYHTSPDNFAESLQALGPQLRECGKDPATFPNGIATMWSYVTDSEAEARRMLEQVLGPILDQPPESLRRKLPIGSPEQCAERLRPYRKAGAQRIFIWPLADETRQLELFQEQVVPLIEQD